MNEMLTAAQVHTIRAAIRATNLTHLEEADRADHIDSIVRTAILLLNPDVANLLANDDEWDSHAAAYDELVFDIASPLY